jgi:hypothetical protein
VRTRQTPRILFAGQFNWHAGSSHMMAEYAKAAPEVGCEVGVSSQLSWLDGEVDSHLPLVDDITWATHLVLVFEAVQYLSLPQLELCAGVPRHRRFVIDPDARWGPYVTADADHNSANYRHASWQKLYTALSDVILQPRIGTELPDQAQYFPYFGMPEIHRAATDRPAPQGLPYDLQYVGANWWRWDEMTGIVRSAKGARPPIRRMRVCGRWWAGPLAPEGAPGIVNEPTWMKDAGVEVAPPVPFGQVVAAMSEAAITPVLARPLLARLGLLTPRMFETLASGSIPVLSPHLAYLTELYGDDLELFLLGDDPSAQLGRMLREPARYREPLTRIQHRVHQRFNYRSVLIELMRLTRS